MNLSKSKLFVSAALVLTGSFGVGMAQAAPVDLQWSIVIGSPVYSRPAPVLVRPWPLYTRPAPVRVQPMPLYPRDAYLQPTRWDRDGDGIPNRHDRLYNPHWDRDGDGVPNRHDRRAGPGR
jgi:hypothetical protein